MQGMTDILLASQYVHIDQVDHNMECHPPQEQSSNLSVTVIRWHERISGLVPFHMSGCEGLVVADIFVLTVMF